MQKKRIGLSFSVITLALLVVFSFVAISHLLLKTDNTNPSTAIDISVSDHVAANHSQTEQSSSPSANPALELVGGKGKAYQKELPIFYAEYGKDGKISVKSALGDHIVAPGTDNQYDLLIRNVGKVPIHYTLEAKAHLTVDVGNAQTEIPIDASFSSPAHKYLLGSDKQLAPLEELNGITDSYDLSADHQARYTLRWSWPWDGDDTFDTLLGNLAVEGEPLTVKVVFQVTATYDPEAAGGTPLTGDTSTIGLWVALFVTSLFSLIILLFWRKRDQDEEDE